MEAQEIMVAFASSLAGAVVGAVIPLFLPGKAKNGRPPVAAGRATTVTGGHFHGSTHVGDNVWNLTEDHRVIINGPAVQEVIHLAPVPERRARRSEAVQRESSSEGWEPWVVGGLALLLIVMGYLRYRETVTLTVTAISAFAMFLPLGALAVARQRAVAFDRRQTLQLTVNVLLVCVSLLGLYLLSNPAFGVDRSQFAALLEAGKQAGFRELLDRFGGDWILFVAYQLIGLAVSVLSVAAIAFHSLKVYAVVGAAVRAENDPTYRPGPVRGRLIHAGGPPGRVFTGAVVLAALSIVLISGAGYAVVSSLQSDMEFPAPAPALPTDPALAPTPDVPA